jgi:hypothetical protein
MFIDGFGWGLRHGFAKLQERRRKQWEQQRAADADNFRKFGHMAPSLDY